MAVMLLSVADDVARALETLDWNAARATYWRQNEFLVLERLFPAPLVARWLEDVERVRPSINRNYIPRHKKGGSVSHHTLKADAPSILGLYQAPAFLEFVRAITGRQAAACPERDPHACALYFYTEPGDHIGFHYDTSYYKGLRYTVLVGLIERSSSRLVCQLYRDDPSRATEELALATHPGTVVLFNGDKLWHSITPLGEGEERVSLTLEYVTDPAMNPFLRVFSDLKDAFAYFGLRQVFGGAKR
jgi:hypothetical protein